MGDEVRVVNQTRGTVLAERAGVAASTWARGKGLLGRKALPPGEGLVIQRCNSVHCFFMAFTIDVVYVDKAIRVVRLGPQMRPGSVGPIVWKARDVIELPAGTIAASATAVGDQLVLEAVLTAGS